MFCNNCGSKLPDGSRFCSVCGTRLVDLEPVVTEAKSASSYGYAEEVRTDAERSESYENVAARVSFDWSNVIEEPVKKVVPEVRSPWVEPVVEERPAVEKPALDHRRTMSFIEILKQEREEKLRAAELEAAAVTARQEVAPDYTAFENAPQTYSDFAKNVEAPLYDEPVIEEPQYEERPFGFETADLTDFEPPLHTLAEEAAAADPLFDTSNLFKDIDEPSIELPAIEEEAPIEIGETLNVEDFYNQTLDFGQAAPGNLEAELDAILNAGASRLSRAERHAAEEVEEAPVEEYAETIVEDYVEVPVEEYAEAPVEVYAEDLAEEAAEAPEVELTMPIEEAPVFEEAAEEAPAIEFAEPSEFEPPLEEPQFDEELFAPAEEETIAPFAETEEAEVESEVEIEVPVYTYDESMFAPAGTVDEPEEIPEIAPEVVAAPEVAPVADEDSEIEELKKRLAMLMSDEPEEASAPVVEITETDEETDEELGEPVEVTADLAEEPELATDAISLDELEKELFGDEVPEEGEAEATKKIDKFYTLYKKNEEFQRLLEEEYDKLKEADEAETKDDAEEKPEEAAEETAPAEAKADDKAEAKANAKAEKAAAKKAAKEAKKEAKKSKKSDAEDEETTSGGSGILTVLAVIIAVLLVVLLGVILVLNFAPDSGIAMTIDSLIENVASYFSDAGMIDKISLL